MDTESLFDELLKQGVSVHRRGFDEYLRDESRFQGHAEGFARVTNPAHVSDVLTACARRRVPVTVVSGKTSLTGSSVPMGGLILDVKPLDAIDPEDPTIVGPGVILKHYKDFVDGLGLFYPPDPTSEESCALGGNLACNASGALSYLYGPTRDYIRGLRVALPMGSVLDIERGRVFSQGGRFTIPPSLFEPRLDRDLIVPAPSKGAPPWRVLKSSAGLYADDPMDLVDLFIGSEGILGVIVEARTILRPRRRPRFTVMLYLPSREFTVKLVSLLDSLKRWGHDRDPLARDMAQGLLDSFSGQTREAGADRFFGIIPACMEWFSSSVARFMSPARARRLAGRYGALCVEQEYDPSVGPLDVASQWAELVEFLNSRIPGEVPRLETEVALDEKQARDLRNERKAVPEGLNELIRPGMVKIGMDYSVPTRELGPLMELYDSALPPHRSYVFGHIGNAHLHVNILPENPEQERADRDLSKSVARAVIAMRGSVSGEHGIGKLKREALEMMIGRDGVEEIAGIKRVLDPEGILNPGNMFLAAER